MEPVGPGPSNGGRPPDLLRFNSKMGYVIGVDIGTAVVRVALADLNGAVVTKWIASTHSRSTPERVAGLIKGGIRQMQRQHKIPSKKLLVLAAGAPGITDASSGVVLSAPMLPAWRDIPLRRILESETGIPAAIENDVNLAALGESWQGTARGIRNFVFLTIGTGVGAGVFLNGRLYHGSDWTAGEIGYLYVPGTEETPLALRRPGSLESIIGAKAIKRGWLKLCDASDQSSHHLPRNISAAEIFDLAKQGESHAVAILERTARILADALTNVCVILDPSLVVLGGRIGSHPSLFEATHRIVERNEFCRPRLSLSALGNEAALFGAIWLALKAAEKKVLPCSAVDASRTLASEEISSLFQPFLGLARPD